jgi:pimeloyl-ACP methyl ester carboxylesterase
MRKMKKLAFMIFGGLLSVLILSSATFTNANAQDNSAENIEEDCLSYPPEGWANAYVLANGIRIHYWRTGGDKQVMVMAHGSSDNGLCWTNLARELVADYDIILFDARGHGLSDPPSKSDGPDAQCEDLAGLIRELGLEKPILMGHSMGSSSVAWFAARYPDVPGAVILEDPGLIPRSSGNARSSASDADIEIARARIIERNNMSTEAMVAQCIKNDPQWGKCECEFWAPSKKLHHPNNAYRRFGGRGPEKSELFPMITAPTLILKADAQGEVRKKNEEAAALLPNGRIVHVEGARHNVRRDQKEGLLQALNTFLGEL